MQWIRKYYEVPARRGVRVAIDGRRGVITGSINQYIRVRMDGDKLSRPYHPRWMCEYEDRK